MRKAFIDTLIDKATNDDRICLIVGDLGYSVVEPFSERFPDRFLNVGVAEQNMIGVATGWSLSEKKIVFCYSIANFPVLRCLEQIRNDVCYHRADVKIVSVGAGLTYGSAGPSHHAVEDLAVMRAMPGMIVLSPCDGWEAKAVTQAAIESEGPCYIRLGKNGEPTVHDGSIKWQMGDHILYRDRDGLLFVTTGPISMEVIEAADILTRKGWTTAVVGIPSLQPLNAEPLVRLFGSAKAIVAIEEHSAKGGLGTLVAETLALHGVYKPFFRLKLPDLIEKVGSQRHLRSIYGLDAEGIVDAVLSFNSLLTINHRS